MIRSVLSAVFICSAGPVLACTTLHDDIAFCFENTYWHAADATNFPTADDGLRGGFYAHNDIEDMRLIVHWDRRPKIDSRLLYLRTVASERLGHPGCSAMEATDACPRVDWLNVPAAFQESSESVVAFRTTFPGPAFSRHGFNGTVSVWSFHRADEADAVVVTKRFLVQELSLAHLMAHRRASDALQLGSEVRVQ